MIAKINPDGTEPVYVTYMGGDGDDSGKGIAVDHDGTVYITGTTSSVNFPVYNAVQSTLSGGTDAFVSSLSADGSRSCIPHISAAGRTRSVQQSQ